MLLDDFGLKINRTGGKSWDGAILQKFVVAVTAAQSSEGEPRSNNIMSKKQTKSSPASYVWGVKNIAKVGNKYEGDYGKKGKKK